MFLSPNPVAQNYKNRYVKLLIPVSIVANATPASKKVNFGELGAVCFLRTEGQTAVVDAMEAIGTTNFTTPLDNIPGSPDPMTDPPTCVFGIFVQGLTNLGRISKVLKATIIENGTAIADSIALTKVGLSSSGVSVNNNVCLDVTGTNLVLDTQSPSLLIELHLMVENK